MKFGNETKIIQELSEFFIRIIIVRKERIWKILRYLLFKHKSSLIFLYNLTAEHFTRLEFLFIKT